MEIGSLADCISAIGTITTSSMALYLAVRKPKLKPIISIVNPTIVNIRFGLISKTDLNGSNNAGVMIKLSVFNSGTRSYILDLDSVQIFNRNNSFIATSSVRILNNDTPLKVIKPGDTLYIEGVTDLIKSTSINDKLFIRLNSPENLSAEKRLKFDPEEPTYLDNFVSSSEWYRTLYK